MIDSRNIATRTVHDLAFAFAAATYEKNDGTDEAVAFSILGELSRRKSEDRREFNAILQEISKFNRWRGKTYFERLQGAPGKDFVSKILADEMKGWIVQAEYKDAMSLWTGEAERAGKIENLVEGSANSVASIGDAMLEHPILAGAFIGIGAGLAMAGGGLLAPVGAGARILSALPKVARGIEIFGAVAGGGFVLLGGWKISEAASEKAPISAGFYWRESGEAFGNAGMGLPLSKLGKGLGAIRSALPDQKILLLKSLTSLRGSPAVQALNSIAQYELTEADIQKHGPALIKAIESLKSSEISSAKEPIRRLSGELAHEYPLALAQLDRVLELHEVPELLELLEAQRVAPSQAPKTLSVLLAKLKVASPAERLSAAKKLEEVFSKPLLTARFFSDGSTGLLDLATALVKESRDPAALKIAESWARELMDFVPRGGRSRYSVLLDSIEAAKGREAWIQRERLLALSDHVDGTTPGRFLDLVEENASRSTEFWEALDVLTQEGFFKEWPLLSEADHRRWIDFLSNLNRELPPGVMAAYGKRALKSLLCHLPPEVREAMLISMVIDSDVEISGFAKLLEAGSTLGIGKVSEVRPGLVSVEGVDPELLDGNRIWELLPDSIDHLAFRAKDGTRGLMTRFRPHSRPAFSLLTILEAP